MAPTRYGSSSIASVLRSLLSLRASGAPAQIKDRSRSPVSATASWPSQPRDLLTTLRGQCSPKQWRMKPSVADPSFLDR